MKKLVITQYCGKVLSMLFEDNKEIVIELYEKNEEDVLDNIYVGRVKDIVPNINAAFVETAPGNACYFSLIENQNPIFLNNKNNNKLCQGDLVLVQVKKEALKTKAPVVSCNINLSGKYAALSRGKGFCVGVSKKITSEEKISHLKEIAMPYTGENYGFVMRTDSADASDCELTEELTQLVSEYKDLVTKAAMRTAFTLMKKSESPVIRDITSYRLGEEDEIITDIQNLYDEITSKFTVPFVRLYEDLDYPLIKAYSMESRFLDALKPRVWLKSGGYLIIEPTEALTVIDVNTGKFDGNGKDKEKTFLKINMEAAKEISRQLMLRNISGMIIVDFISMEKKENIKELSEYIKKLLLSDIVPAKFVDFTKLGLAEITRKKIKKSLREKAVIIKKQEALYEEGRTEN